MINVSLTGLNLYRVKPLFGALLNQYCPPIPGIHSYYPATLFLQRVLNDTSKTMDNEAIIPNAAWMDAIAADLERLNPGRGSQAMDYLKNPSNGQWFTNGMNICVFPGDVVNILRVNDWPATAGRDPFKMGEYWGEVQTVPYTDMPPVFSTLSNYLFSYQSDENSLGNVITAAQDKGLMMRFPRISNDKLYINMDCVEPL